MKQACDTIDTEDVRSGTKTFRISAVLRLCAVGFLYNCQPSEPFLTRYLKEDKGISEHVLDDYVWPFDTYGSFLFLLPVGLLAESAGYRPAIFLGIVLREITRLVLLFAPGPYWAAFMQLTYAGATAVNYVYYAYVYTVFDREDYPFATAAVHAAYHAGNVLGSLTGQILMDHGHVRLKTLFYLSWVFTTLSAVSFFFLPRPRREPPPSLAASLRRNGLRRTFDALRRMYDSEAVRLWSCWWIFGLIAHSIVSNYYQNQFYNIDPRAEFGYAEAVMELFSAAGAAVPFVVGFGKATTRLGRSWRVDTTIVVVVSCVMGFSCVASTLWTESIWISYACNTVALAAYAALSSVACFVIPSQLVGDEASTGRYAMVFTTNSFVALGLATLLMKCGSGAGWNTNDFYYAAAGSNAVLVVVGVPILLLLRRATSPSSYDRIETNESDRAVELEHDAPAAYR